MRWWERLAAWADRHRLPVDAATAAALGLVSLPGAVTFGTGAGATAVALAVSAVMVVALVWRRTAPAASAAVVYLGGLVHVLSGELLVVPADGLVLVALHSVTVHGPVWAYRTALGGALAGVTLVGAMTASASGLGSFAEGVSMATALGLAAVTVFALSLVRRARKESITALVDRARRLEVERDQQAQIATAAERARIAREMHDIVAHSLSVVVAQADGGRYAAAAEPAAADRALVTIAETGRAALADMRRLLGVLRPDDARPGQQQGVTSDPPPAAAAAGVPGTLRPQPSAEDLETLVAQVRASGLRVSLVRAGAPRRLPPGTGLTVYRIAQESLTNVLKHAGPDVTVTVLVQWLPRSLVLEVVDDGRGAATVPDGGGHGLVGMHERATMLGGTVTAGPRPGGGYRVRAEIPLPAPLETS